MTNTQKSLTEYILDENHFKDFEYEFDYCIIHQRGGQKKIFAPIYKAQRKLVQKIPRFLRGLASVSKLLFRDKINYGA